ncbi:MAG: peroxiredoxin [Myxococcales bacterium]|nr:peroxiredoxin [Myxococcales bacterium]
MIRPIAFTVFSFVALACGGEAATTASGSAAASGSSAALGDGLKPGDAAPAVTMTLQDGKKVELASLKDKLVLVYFYPKDDTPGCTVEAQGVRDAWKDFQAAGIDVYGVSTQDAASHQAFIEKHELPFPLVVDEGGAIATAFKVPLKNGNASRQSFLIGKDGKIKAAWPNVVPAEHAATVLAAAKS